MLHRFMAFVLSSIVNQTRMCTYIYVMERSGNTVSTESGRRESQQEPYEAHTHVNGYM